MRKLKKQRGITLVTLVITIIILLLLAGISIAALTNQGLFGQANRSKDLTAQKAAEENETLENYLAQMNAYDTNNPKVDEDIFKNVDKTKTNPEAAMPKRAIVLEADANKGIVIKDSNENEWTWVEVPMSVTKDKTTDSDIESALIAYATDYREGATGQELSWKDEWYDGCGMAESEYNTTKSKMLQSIKSNGGFWISRYEIGDVTATESNTTRTADSGITGAAVSKANQIPYNFVKCSEAQTLAKGMSDDSSKTSSLLFGIQWDLTCKFIEKNLKIDYIKNDSTNWGNYKNSSLTLYRGKYVISPLDTSNKWKMFNENTDNYVNNCKTLNNENYQLLTTGASEETKIMNIYDLAGNEWEWTLEHATSDVNLPATVRGGSFYYEGSVDPISVRGNNYAIEQNSDFGFRSVLY